MKKEELDLVKEAIELHEYYSNFFHRINGASVRITNLKKVKDKFYYTATLIYSETGQKSVYPNCYMDKNYVDEIILKRNLKIKKGI